MNKIIIFLLTLVLTIITACKEDKGEVETEDNSGYVNNQDGSVSDTSRSRSDVESGETNIISRILSGQKINKTGTCEIIYVTDIAIIKGGGSTPAQSNIPGLGVGSAGKPKHVEPPTLKSQNILHK